MFSTETFILPVDIVLNFIFPIKQRVHQKYIYDKLTLFILFNKNRKKIKHLVSLLQTQIIWQRRKKTTQKTF